jgi:hypothetical protein
MARRFVSDMLAETDATFNTNEKRMLLQCFVGIDNTGHTFGFLQAFSAAESGRIVRFILEVLSTHYFYDCPGFAVLAEDFGSGLTAGFAQKAAQDAKDATERERKKVSKTGKEKVQERDSSPDELSADYEPLPTASTRPDYEPDSQTIIVNADWIRAIKPTMIGVH